MALPKTAGLPDVVILGNVPQRSRFIIRARLMGSRIDTRSMSLDPAAQAVGTRDAMSVVLRDGVVVTVGFEEDIDPLLDTLIAPYLTDAEQWPESEVTAATLRPGGGDRIGSDGQVQLTDASPERFLLLAIVLARSVMLSRDEILVAEAFDHISPLVADLRHNGRAHLSIKQAMQLVGDALGARHRIMGTAQANDRPDLLWDHPELDRLYTRLEAEYELDERAEVLERKFVALGDVAEVLLDIVRDKRAFRVELAIIVLITLEILLSLLKMV